MSHAFRIRLLPAMAQRFNNHPLHIQRRGLKDLKGNFFLPNESNLKVYLKQHNDSLKYRNVYPLRSYEAVADAFAERRWFDTNETRKKVEDIVAKYMEHWSQGQKTAFIEAMVQGLENSAKDVPLPKNISAT